MSDVRAENTGKTDRPKAKEAGVEHGTASRKIAISTLTRRATSKGVLKHHAAATKRLVIAYWTSSAVFFI
jgi:hypothetical protein